MRSRRSGRPKARSQTQKASSGRKGPPSPHQASTPESESGRRTKTQARRNERRETKATLRDQKQQFGGGRGFSHRSNFKGPATEETGPRPSVRPRQENSAPAFTPPPPSAPRKGGAWSERLPAKLQVNPASLAGKIIQGRVDIHPDGFGFFISKDPSIPNIYVGEESLKSVMHRDEVMLRVDKSFEGGAKLRGTVVSIARRVQKEFLGVYRPFRGGALVVPLETRDRKHSFKLTGPAPADLKAGAAVLSRVLTYPDKGQGTVEILNTIEDPTSPSNDTLRLLLEAGWPREFSRAALQEAEMRAHGWRGSSAPHKRRDLRKLPLVTIDGRDAKDFDDAVCAEREGQDIRLWVAIADVSHFVKPGTALDQEAFDRSTSVYFPDHVVPMLPEILSNGVCSLNPFEERACLVAEMVVDRDGRIKNYEMYEGLMQSRRRMTYEDMQAFIEGQFWATNELAPLSQSLSDLVEVFQRLRRAKNKRGAIDLDLPEPKIMMNRDGTILDIQPRERLDAHRLIEECMLAANECAAKFLHSHGEGVYRIHEPPDPKRVEDLKRFLATVGIEIHELEDPIDFGLLLERVKNEFGPEDPTARAIGTLLLRSLKQARYSSMRVGHFALANKDYTHFTSPIRRYPDLMVHRLVKHFLRIEKNVLPARMDLESACQHCSDQERAAMDCERKLIDTKKCRYMENRLGEEFDAWVSGVTEKGVFVQIDGHFVDGLVSADALWKAARHKYDQEQLAYVGPGKSKIGLGTRLRVQLAAVDILTRKIDFGLIEHR